MNFYKKNQIFFICWKIKSLWKQGEETSFEIAKTLPRTIRVYFTCIFVMCMYLDSIILQFDLESAYQRHEYSKYQCFFFRWFFKIFSLHFFNFFRKRWFWKYQIHCFWKTCLALWVLHLCNVQRINGWQRYIFILIKLFFFLFLLFFFSGFIQDEGNIICPECARKKMLEEMEAESQD